MDRPEVYDGSSEWRIYQLFFMQCVKVNAWTPARMVQILGVYLRGVARLFHAELKENVRTDWELSAEMALRFDQLEPELLPFEGENLPGRTANPNPRIRSAPTIELT